MRKDKDDKMLQEAEFEMLGSDDAVQPQNLHDFGERMSSEGYAGGDDNFCLLGSDPIKKPPMTEDLPPNPEGFFTKLKRRLLCLGRYHYIPLIIILLLTVIVLIILLCNYYKD